MQLNGLWLRKGERKSVSGRPRKCPRELRSRSTRSENQRRSESRFVLQTYHKVVQSGVMMLGESRKKTGGIKKAYKDRDIAINYTTRRLVHYYRPDACFETRFGKREIFEVLDDELKDKNLIIADIIQAFLTPAVSKVVFIVPDEESQEIVTTLSTVILGRLAEELKTKISKLLKVFYVIIPKSEASSTENVLLLLQRDLSPSLRIGSASLRGSFTIRE